MEQKEGKESEDVGCRVPGYIVCLGHGGSAESRSAQINLIVLILI